MKLLAYFRSIAPRFLQPHRTCEDLDEELHSHVQHRADDLERTGLSRGEAERLARIEFGGHSRYKEESYEALGGNFIDTLVKDLRYSVRVLRKSPGFTIAAVLTLALAIGANAIVFGVLNALILRPLNVPHAESLYGIESGGDKVGYQSYPNYVDLRDRNRSFEDLAVFNITAAGLDTGGNPAPAWVYETSGNYFDALGIQPYLGRFFHGSDENGPNSAPFIVLTYPYWESHFGGDRGVVGTTVLLNKHPFTILGIAPPDFRGTLLFFSTDVFVPIVDHEQISGDNVLNTRGDQWVFEVLGHLKTGVTPAQAIADLNSIGVYFEKTYPQEDGKMTFAVARPSLYGDFLGGPVRAFVAGLMLLATLILLAACANLGSLFAARAADRAREVALRLALGASRNRILRQLFTEAVLISLAGGAIGLWGSVVLLRQLSGWQPLPRFPISVPVNADANVFAAALILALVSGLLFSIVPVRQVLRADPYEIVKAGSATAIGRRVTVRDLLLVLQIAICGVLVTSSMVAVRGLARSLHSNFGFDPRNAILVEADLNMGGYRGARAPEMQKRMLDTLAAIPGVETVALVNPPPLAMDGNTTTIYTDETTDMRRSNVAAVAYAHSMSPDYLRAARTVLLAGRTFTWHDDEKAPRVAIVNRQFADKIFGSVTNAVGKYYKRRSGTRIQVVGIVEDGKYLNLTEPPQPAVFLPILQEPASDAWLVVRSNGDLQQVSASVKSTLRDLDSALPFYIQTWGKEMEASLFASRVATVALGVLGGMGAMLAITGIFGMAAYSVSRRLKELGIRIAIGAKRQQVLQAALGRAFKLLAIGSAVGLLLGIMASRVLSVIVYLATPRDPLVLGGVVIAMALLGLLATWIPAQRAMSVDPLKLLREE